jgi:2-polyprenyl-6-methoxyphenol hydroxylase-like FAD-dependent oxidoreductase
MSTTLDADVLVVGGGPIGLAAAIEASLAGRRPVVVEPRDGPVDKACGEGLMPGAVAALDRLGVHPDGHPLAGIRYQDARRRVTHRFRERRGLGVRRTTLHAALAARADELGVERLTAKVTELRQDDGSVTAAGVRARWLFGCDGLHSTVRRLAGLEAPARGPRRYGVRRHFRLAPWTDVVEVHWGPTAEAYVTPVAADLGGIALLGPPTSTAPSPPSPAWPRTWRVPSRTRPCAAPGRSCSGPPPARAAGSG